MGSLLAVLLGRAIPEELIEAHGDAGQEADVLLEVHLAVLVVVQVVHEPLELGIIHLLLWRGKSGVWGAWMSEALPIQPHCSQGRV